jgi:ATP-dependent helicase YprA (DUF1998 family)
VWTLRLELLVGHSLGLSDHYLRHSEQSVLTEYLKAVDSLTINEENRVTKKVETLTIRADKFDELNKKVEVLTKIKKIIISRWES